MIRLKRQRDRSGERVLPACYDGSYVSPLPRAQRTVRVSFDAAALAGESPQLPAEGWAPPEGNPDRSTGQFLTKQSDLIRSRSSPDKLLAQGKDSPAKAQQGRQSAAKQ